MVGALGTKKKEIIKVCEFGINLDERIADGYYFAKSVKLIQYIFDNPTMLENRADEKIKLDEISVPLKQGDIVGRLYVMNNDEIINEVDLTVKKDVEKCNLFELYFKYLKNILGGNIKF